MTLRISRPTALFRNTDGTAAIEYAIVLPILTLLIFGIVEFSILMFATSSLESAVIAAAREGGTADSINSTNRQARVSSLINSRLNALFNTQNLQVDVTAYNDLAQTPVSCNPQPCPNVNLRGQGSVQLYRVSYAWPVRTPLLGRIIGRNGVYDMVSTTVVRNEPGTYPLLSR